MGSRKVELRFEEDVQRWRIFWSGTAELADERDFEKLEDAGARARELMPTHDQKFADVFSGRVHLVRDVPTDGRVVSIKDDAVEVQMKDGTRRQIPLDGAR
jgi:hypothetical protein